MRATFLSVTGLADIVLWRDGGQRQARRNAWTAMVVDAARARARSDADAALQAALAAGPREAKPLPTAANA